LNEEEKTPMKEEPTQFADVYRRVSVVLDSSDASLDLLERIARSLSRLNQKPGEQTKLNIYDLNEKKVH
jgi:hypothetical protein